MARLRIDTFDLVNKLYANAEVTFYTVSAGVKTATKATLYAGATGTATVENPQTLNSKGLLLQEVWVDAAVVGSIDASRVTDHDTGVSNAAASPVGTANTGTTAEEVPSGRSNVTVLTVDTTLPAIAGGAALAVGKLLYTFPAGPIVIHGARMDLAITQTDGNITADTPDGGLGTTLASGANATLSAAGAATENVLAGQTFDDCNGTAEEKTVDTSLVIEAADNHTLYFNVADTWAASGDAAALLEGTVVVEWTHLGD